MGDIFDEVVAMDDADAEMATETVEGSGDAHFNEAELDDIMAEIDNLEKDFEAEVVVAAQTAEELQTDPEITMSSEVISEDISEDITEHIPVEMAAEKIEEIPVATKVLSFEKKAPPTMPELQTTTTSNVALSATGNMALNLTFKIGEENATLVIDQEKGLLVSFSGVELSLHAEKGCTVEMANGVLFTVPVQSGVAASKKKSA